MAPFLFTALFVVTTLATVSETAPPEANACQDDGQGLRTTSLIQLKTMSKKAALHHSQDVLNKTETDFVARVLTSFGKQSPDYSGPQILLGFRPGAVHHGLVDDKGMFAFDDSVKSVAIDVGAANNPLAFDMGEDANQVVLAFEPNTGMRETLANDMEKWARDIFLRGGCKSRWEPHCTDQRLVVFPAAMSSEVGYAEFHLGHNPYCSSLNTYDLVGGVDPTLLNHPVKEVRDTMASCWGSLTNTAHKFTVPTVTLASILRRIPAHIRIKYIKIDAQGHDFKILQSAGDQMSRIEYVRFEMQVDPPPGRKMVADIPSYAQVESTLASLGFVHDPSTACHFDPYASNFFKAIEEKECVFCREWPCQESGVPPLGASPPFSERWLLQKEARKMGHKRKKSQGHHNR